jgi:hypothetical protein
MLIFLRMNLSVYKYCICFMKGSFNLMFNIILIKAINIKIVAYIFIIGYTMGLLDYFFASSTPEAPKNNGHHELKQQDSCEESSHVSSLTDEGK